MGGSAMICRDCCVSASCRGELNTEETETDREEDNRGKEGRPDRMDGLRQSRRHRQVEGDVVPPLIEITHRYGKRTGGCGCSCNWQLRRDRGRKSRQCFLSHLLPE